MNFDFSKNGKDSTDLWNFINNLDIYDTHEHLLPNLEGYRALKRDFVQEILCTYLRADLISAGMEDEKMKIALNPNTDLGDKWAVIDPYWKEVKTTGYGLMVQIACQDIFREELEKGTIQKINDKYQELMSRDFFAEILKNKSKIALSIIDRFNQFSEDGTFINIIDSKEVIDQRYFNCVYRLDNFIFPKDWNDIRYIEAKFNREINSLDNWVEACEKSLRSAVEKGIIGVKTALAYNRSLKFEFTSKEKAEKDFIKILRSRRDISWEKHSVCAGVNLQNYMMHQILHLLETIKIPIQFHTGFQAGNGNFLLDANPLLLTNLFIHYPNVKFILLHMGFPYQQETASLVKMFRNVYLDLSWSHIVSPEAVVRGLGDWIHMLPQNKITVFGGDLSSVVFVYGHQKISRRNIYKALIDKVNRRDLKLDYARVIAEKWFVSNIQKIYSI